MFFNIAYLKLSNYLCATIRAIGRLSLLYAK